ATGSRASHTLSATDCFAMFHLHKKVFIQNERVGKTHSFNLTYEVYRTKSAIASIFYAVLP
ncbi:MAG: hypothetical protein IKE18_06535, partial [Oscillospiraceae bacterium]|nr:hypothetical protein [Oscillospiraceae bacterium]